MKHSAVIVRALIALVVTLLIGFFLFHLNWWYLLLILFGAAGCESVLYLLNFYGFKIWK